MDNLARVRKYLGGTKALGSPENEMDFVPIIRQGLPFYSFTTLRDRSKLSEDVICKSLGIAKRTVARRKEQTARLKPRESELLIRLARVLSEATEVLGSEAKARGWLMAENRALGGAKPIQLLDTGMGFDQVMAVLVRIGYGVYS